MNKIRTIALLCSVSLSLPACTPSLKAEAKDFCETAIKLTLKSPASAKFDRLAADEHTATIMVRGTVHSQNSFGAMLPTSFWCEFEKTNNAIKLHRTCVQGLTDSNC